MFFANVDRCQVLMCRWGMAKDQTIGEEE